MIISKIFSNAVTDRNSFFRGTTFRLNFVIYVNIYFNIFFIRIKRISSTKKIVLHAISPLAFARS